MFRFGGLAIPDLVDELARMNRAFDWSWQPGPAACGFPAIDVYDEGEQYVVRAQLPGVDPKELEIEATARALSIKGERKPAGDEQARYRRRERETGSFARSIKLPQPVDPDAIVAKYENGVLELTLRKADEARPRRVAVA